MRDWFRAFANAAKERRYVLGATVTTAIVICDNVSRYLIGHGMTGPLGFPSWVVGSWVAAIFIGYWLLARLVELERRIAGGGLHLARLRTEGVGLRNQFHVGLITQSECEAWLIEINRWNRAVISEVSKINEADAEWFSVLDVIPPSRLDATDFETADEDARHQYGFHDFRLVKLETLIVRYGNAHVSR